MRILARLSSRRCDRQFLIAVISAVCLVAYFFGYLLRMHPPRDQYGYVVGRDFVNTWMGARAVLSGRVGDLLHVNVYMQQLVAVLGPMPPHNWSYPPTLLLFIWPLGFAPYLGAYAAWSLAGLAAYLGASACFDRSARTLMFVAAAPAVAVALFSGQTGFFTAALMILLCRYLDERPTAAGICLGMLICKPHLAVLFPLALALSGRWRAFWAAAATVFVLAGAAAIVFGPSVWADYFRLVVPVQKGVLNTGTGFLSMMPTGLMNARMMGASIAVAWLVQIPFTLLSVAAIVWTFRVRRDPILSFAVLITTSVVATPYAFNYDMVVFGWLAAVLWPRFERFWDRCLLLAVWSLPVTMMPLGDAHLPVSAPLMAVFLMRLVMMLRDEQTAAQPNLTVSQPATCRSSPGPSSPLASAR